MKICHLSYGTRYGGADIAAKRLHLAQKRFFGCHENIFLCADRKFFSGAKKLFSPLESAALHAEQSLLYRFDTVFNGRSDCARIYNYFPSPAVKRIIALKPDVVHLHSVVGEMLSIAGIAELAQKVPVVWTMHDTWSFSGCEQYFSDDQYLNGYRRKGIFDLDYFSFNKKMKLWANVPIQLVAPSRWIGECASRSMIHRGRDIRTIGNTLDDTIFTPGDKCNAKYSFGLAPDHPVVAFGCSDFSSPNKASRLNKLLLFLKDLVPDCQFLAVGGGKVPAKINCKTLGKVSKEETLARFYRAADVFVHVSKIDNLPNMILESLFCGTPVGAIITGGIGDLVNDTTGFPADNEISLAEKVSGFLLRREPNKGVAAAKFAAENYSPKTIAEKHFDLYQNLTEQFAVLY